MARTYGDSNIYGWSFDVTNWDASMFEKCKGMKLRTVFVNENHDKSTSMVHVVFEEIEGDGNDSK